MVKVVAIGEKGPVDTIKDADVEAGNAQTILAFDEEGTWLKPVPTGTVTIDGALSDERKPSAKQSYQRGIG